MKCLFRVESMIVDEENYIEGIDLRDCVIKFMNKYFYGHKIVNDKDVIDVLNEEMNIKIELGKIDWMDIILKMIDGSFDRGEVIWYVKVGRKVIYNQDKDDNWQ